jgi:hypothetical protein
MQLGQPANLYMCGSMHGINHSQGHDIKVTAIMVMSHKQLSTIF